MARILVTLLYVRNTLVVNVVVEVIMLMIISMCLFPCFPFALHVMDRSHKRLNSMIFSFFFFVSLIFSVVRIVLFSSFLALNRYKSRSDMIEA